MAMAKAMSVATKVTETTAVQTQPYCGAIAPIVEWLEEYLGTSAQAGIAA